VKDDKKGRSVTRRFYGGVFVDRIGKGHGGISAGVEKAAAS
jgi:hypothetical protein